MAGMIEIGADGWRQENGIGCRTIDYSIAESHRCSAFPEHCAPEKNKRNRRKENVLDGSHDVMMRT